MSEWSLYLIRCRDGKLYTGISTDVEQRVRRHETGEGARFTRGKGPFELAFSTVVGDRSLASRLEWRVKRLQRSKKEDLIRGDLTMDQLLSSLE